MSFGEVLLIGIVALIVVGPRNLPSLMRTLGQWVGRLRRMAMDMRAQSGIDDILRAEGIQEELATFRDLANGRVLLDQPALMPAPFTATNTAPPPVRRFTVPDREREYPRVGCDNYGAAPEDIVPYVPSREPAKALPAVGALPGEAPAAPAEPSSPEPEPEREALTSETRSSEGPVLPTAPEPPAQEH